jgi:hypothetical protein
VYNVEDISENGVFVPRHSLRGNIVTTRDLFGATAAFKLR